MAAKTKKTGKSTATQFPPDFYHDPLGVDRYVVQEKDLYTWKSPTKLERQRHRNDIIFIVLFSVILSLILVMLNELFLILVVAAGTFTYIVLMLSPVNYLDCHITTIGLKVEGKYFFWSQLTQFWFENRRNARVLQLRCVFPTVHVLKFLIPPEDEQKIAKILGKYLLYKKPQQTEFEKFSSDITEKVLLHFDIP